MTTVIVENEIVLGGKRLERVDLTMERLRVSNAQLYVWHRQGLPKPLKIGSRRFFDPDMVDAWLLAQIGSEIEAVK